MSELGWEGKGYLIDGKHTSNLRLADDTVLVADNKAGMEIMINEINVAGLKTGLEMNTSATQLMVNQWCDAEEVNLAGNIIQQVHSYVYLRRELKMMNKIAPEISRGRRAAWAASGSIREVKDQIKDPDRRVCTFNASVLPPKCFATETWPDNETISGSMRTTHRALERCLLKTNRYNNGIKASEVPIYVRNLD
ncbi:hypothetical protein ANCDUO_24038 [Ancylostoma duodenale]|uniref:Reverse transcriptase domain-containing protein n=1 Tax=Ancylostoma duodenale TaxID=51022 RepID=A0A0C2C8B1_9BILA|nr:hypothetical protein ANCDUO_24038 [Ancylostoma duodenale]